MNELEFVCNILNTQEIPPGIPPYNDIFLAIPLVYKDFLYCIRSLSLRNNGTFKRICFRFIEMQKMLIQCFINFSQGCYFLLKDVARNQYELMRMQTFTVLHLFL